MPSGEKISKCWKIARKMPPLWTGKPSSSPSGRRLGFPNDFCPCSPSSSPEAGTLADQARHSAAPPGGLAALHRSLTGGYGLPCPCLRIVLPALARVVRAGFNHWFDIQDR